MEYETDGCDLSDDILSEGPSSAQVAPSRTVSMGVNVLLHDKGKLKEEDRTAFTTNRVTPKSQKVVPKLSGKFKGKRLRSDGKKTPTKFWSTKSNLLLPPSRNTSSQKRLRSSSKRSKRKGSRAGKSRRRNFKKKQIKTLERVGEGKKRPLSFSKATSAGKASSISLNMFQNHLAGSYSKLNFKYSMAHTNRIEENQYEESENFILRDVTMKDVFPK